jgi:PAS domain S-box-containing protein
VFNPKTGEFKNYDVNDGLQSNEFNSIASCKSKSGEMFFGGINGFNAFFPDSIKDNTHIPRVVITDFQISNKSVPIGKKPDGCTILHKSIVETDEIVLSYTDDVLSFEFAALHFVSPENNQYAYMMEGIDKDWNYIGTRRYVTYSDLSPGKYVLRVKATNNDGVWNEQGTHLRIIVIPPYWETWWFYTLCIAFLIVLAAAAFQYRLKKKEQEERLKVITDISHALEHGQATVYRRSFNSDEYEYIGKGIENITGFSPEEFTRSLWRKILITINVVGDLDGRSFEEAFDQMRKGEIDNFIMDCEFRTKSGYIRWVRDITTALRDASGACYATLGILFEITDRKIAEQELVRISDELLKSSKELGLKNKEMEKDLNLAREIQMALLAKRHYYFPIELPKDQSVLQFTHHYLPASKLAGDFFEIFPISDHEVGFLICDVIGHGTRASLLTFYLRGLIEHLRPDANDPEVFISKLNSGFISIVSRFDSAFFATMFYCVTDSDSCRLRYVNAGHPVPFVLRRSQGLVRKIEENGANHCPAIGILEDFAFTTNEHTLSDDDIVFFFTDGLYEVLGNDEKIFGNKRLFETIQNKLSATPSRMMEEVLSEIQNYAEGNEFEDDVCMVTMHVNRRREA